ncbi:hypothetical protein N0V82_008459 [Gnomoniopsis sp. IMI 355080]|nr:hypothetical protein N0V82_008459 [Gnomoniopsis sp. IMI 355080]
MNYSNESSISWLRNIERRRKAFDSSLATAKSENATSIDEDEAPEKYLFDNRLHQGRSKKAFTGDEHFPWLGRGATFEVFSTTREEATGTALDANSKEVVAVKVPRASGPLNSEEAMKAWEIRMLREVASELSCLVHKPIRNAQTIAKYIGITWRPSHIDSAGHVHMMPSVFLEKAQLGNLDDLLHPDIGGLSGLKVITLKLMAEVAIGMQVLESCGMVHGDLKGSNILIFADENGSSLQAKISDFGFALRTFDLQGHQSTMVKGGSPPWEAPELAACSMNGMVALDMVARADIYSYGLLVWRVALNGQSPFDDRRNAKKFPGFENFEDDTVSIEGLAAQMKAEGDKFLNTVIATIPDEPDGEATTLACFRKVIGGSLRLDPNDRWPSFISIAEIFGRDARDDNASIIDPMKTFRHGSLEVPGSSMSKYAISNTMQNKSSVFDLRMQRKGDQVPFRVQQSIFRDIEFKSKGNEPESLLNLSLCLFLGYGVAPDFNRGLDVMVQAALAGEIRAKALVSRLHKACERDLPPDLPTNDWLFEAAAKGSLIALEELRLSMPSDVVSAARRVHSQKFRFGQLRRHLKTEFMVSLDDPFRDAASISPWAEIGRTGKPYKSLHALALAGGDESLVAFLVNKGANINRINGLGETPLLLAVRAGHVKIASALLRQGADPRPATILGNTPLHYAVFLEPGVVTGLIQLLVFHGAEVDAVSSGSLAEDDFSEERFLCESQVFCGTPLLWAIHAGRADVVHCLLLHGASPTARQAVLTDDFEGLLWDFEDVGLNDIPIAHAGLNADVAIIEAMMHGSHNPSPEHGPLGGVCGSTSPILSKDDFMFM